MQVHGKEGGLRVPLLGGCDQTAGEGDAVVCAHAVVGIADANPYGAPGEWLERVVEADGRDLIGGDSGELF